MIARSCIFVIKSLQEGAEGTTKERKVDEYGSSFQWQALDSSYGLTVDTKGQMKVERNTLSFGDPN